MAVEPTQTYRGSRFAATIGGLIGASVAFVTHTSFHLPAEWTLPWVAALSVAGAIIGMILSRLMRPSEPKRPVRTTTGSGELAPSEDLLELARQTGTRGRVVLAVGKESSTGDLVPVTVETRTAPNAPPPVEIQIFIEKYERARRVPVLEGVLERLPLEEIRERVQTAVDDQRPNTVDEPSFHLVALRSEGPLGSDGKSELGWSFYYVDFEAGLACAATAVRDVIVLHYHTTPTAYRPASSPWYEPGRALEILWEEFPELADEPVYLRWNLPDDLFLYLRDPLVIADIDVQAGCVRNPSALRALLEARNGDPERKPTWSTEEVLTAWNELRPDDFEPLTASGSLRPLSDSQINGPPIEEDDGDETSSEDEERGTDAESRFDLAPGLLAFDPKAIAETARGLFARHGPGVAFTLEKAFSDADDHATRVMLLHVISRLPTGLAPVVLQQIGALDTDKRVKALADDLLRDRRADKLDVYPDPIEPLDFASVREAMGKKTLNVLPLLSTYDPSTLLEPLAEIGLNVTRSRILCGEAPMELSTYLRANRGDGEALLASTPVPVPCHILHIVGSASEVFSQRIQKANLLYDDEQMCADLRSGSPTRVHRAALYLAALRKPSPEGARPLIDGFERGSHDPHLRRAILLALEFMPDPAAIELLESVAKNGGEIEAETAAQVLERRALQPATEQPRPAGDDEAQGAGDDAPSA